MMLYQAYIPQYPLSRFIESLWYGENAPQHCFERLLPNGEMDIVVNLRDATLRIYDHHDLARPRCFAGPIASGVHSRHYVVDTAQQTSLMGVRFRPGGAYRFLGDSADHFQNRHVALEELWGRSAIDLQTRLMEAKTHESRFHCLEETLLDHLDETKQPHPAVAAAAAAFVARHGVASVTERATKSGLSSRRFVELFRREVGVSPKRFCRILRFQRALRILSAEPFPGFATSALGSGYYDQPHLNRDFKDFAGITPSTYLASRGAHYNHVSMVGRGQNRPIPAPATPVE